MFGLMRPQQSCSQKKTNDYHHHRMHYCGTCKTLGQTYGQRTRALLNFDTVFFAEILSHLSKENLSNWQMGFQAINRCFTMPDRERDMPMSLQYAAATNVMLGELKLDDHSKDLPGLKWELARRFFSKPFRQADRQMQEWGMDTRHLWHWIRQQSHLEKASKTNFPSLTALLDHYAEPTAQITAWVFQKGAAVVGRPEQEEALYNLGYRFGRMAYILDAFEDVEKDLFHHQFNPLALYFHADQTLREDQFAQVRQVLLACQDAVVEQLKKLPLPEDVTEQYVVRLFSNLALRLYRERRLPQSFAAQMKGAWEMTVKEVMTSTASWVRSANYYLVSLVVFVLPLTADYVSNADQRLLYQQFAIFTAVLAAIGLGRQAVVQRKKRKAKHKDRQGKGKIRRFFQRTSMFFIAAPCAEDCAASCCETCCQSCCDELCNSLCREGLCKGERGQRALQVLVVLLLILIVVAMILILV